MPTYTTSPVVGGNMSAADTVPGLLGELRHTNTGMFRYGKATPTALVAGDLCLISTDGKYEAGKINTQAAMLPLGVPQSAIPAEQYGWFFIGAGTFNVNIAAGVSNGVKLTTTGTSGQAGSGGTPIGAVATAASGAGGVTTAFAPGYLAASLYS